MTLKDREVVQTPLVEEAKTQYYRYGVEVNEERAISCKTDGMKPVTRRALWSVNDLKGWSNAPLSKSAVYVGHTMGNYHPHGDKAIYDTYVTMVNSAIPLIEGHGNWGTLSDRQPAAFRYTLMRMSKYSERVFFDKFYLPVTPMVPNYDDSGKEPLILNALVPNLLLNGEFGIGVGVRTEVPAYKMDTVLTLITKLFKEKRKCEPKDCLALEFTTLNEGTAEIEKGTLKELYTKGKGRVTYRSSYEISTKGKNIIHITKFAPFSNLEKALSKALDYDEVSKVDDISDVQDRHGRVLIEFKRNLDHKAFQKAAKKVVDACFSSTEHYDIKVTERTIDDKGKGQSRLQPSTVPQIINDWMVFRVDLEKKACAYWVGERDKQIARLELMRHAIKFIDVLVKIIKDKKLNRQQQNEQVSKKLKITIEQAESILGMTLRQLSALSDKDLINEIKQLQLEKKGFKDRIAKPEAYVSKHLVELSKELTKIMEVTHAKNNKRASK